MDAALAVNKGTEPVIRDLSDALLLTPSRDLFLGGKVVDDEYSGREVSSETIELELSGCGCCAAVGGRINKMRV